MKKVLVLLLTMFTLCFCELPVNKIFRGVPADVSSYMFLQNASVPRMQTLDLKRQATEDTITTTGVFSKRSVIEDVIISVDTAVVSQGDTCYFKLFIGNDKILDQKTTAFKSLGGYVFTPLVRYTSADNSTIKWAVENKTSGQTSGITAGKYKVTVRYFIP